MSAQETDTGGRGRGRVEVGVVLSDRMNKTITVAVERASSHPLYQKVVRTRKKFVAHDEHNHGRIGDRVRIAECRPMSRSKRWRLVDIVERAPRA